MRPVTLRPGLPDGLSSAKTLPEALSILIKQAGGIDKFAAELGTSRKTVSRWRNHGAYPEAYVGALRERGIPEHLLRRITREELAGRVRQIEAELEAIRRLL